LEVSPLNSLSRRLRKPGFFSALFCCSETTAFLGFPALAASGVGVLPLAGLLVEVFSAVPSASPWFFRF